MSCNAHDQFPCNVLTTRAFTAALVITVTAVYFILRTRIQQDEAETSPFGVQADASRFARLTQNPQLKRPAARGLILLVVAKLLGLLYCKFCHLIPQSVFDFLNSLNKLLN
jgi:hypothetical protein